MFMLRKIQKYNPAIQGMLLDSMGKKNTVKYHCLFYLVFISNKSLKNNVRLALEMKEGWGVIFKFPN